MGEGKGVLSLGKSRSSLRKQKKDSDAAFYNFPSGVFITKPEQMIRIQSGDSWCGRHRSSRPPFTTSRGPGPPHLPLTFHTLWSTVSGFCESSAPCWPPDLNLILPVNHDVLREGGQEGERGIFGPNPKFF